MKTCEFRVDVFYSPEYRAKFYDILDKEKNKGNLSYKFRLEEAAPPPELIKDAVIIIASSLTIIKILYDFYNEIRKKKGKMYIRVKGKTFDLAAYGIDEAKAKIELEEKPPTKKYFVKLSFPDYSQKEVKKAARTLSYKCIIFNGRLLDSYNTVVAEYNEGNVEAVVSITDEEEINESYEKGKPLYAKAQIDEKYLPRLFFAILILSSKVIPSGSKMKEIVKEEDYPRWYKQ